MTDAKQIPILFSTPMVQAILEGRKTQTRRLVKFPKDYTGGEVYKNSIYGLKYESNLYGDTVQRLAYALPGDIFWVRETWAEFSGIEPKIEYVYKADKIFDTPAKEHLSGNRWKPSIHMPKAACRLFLKVVSVGVERLHDISEADAKAEGAKAASLPDLGNTWKTHKQGFEYLWHSINGEESWKQNPWVWVINFEKTEQ
ncbi:MAG: morphogenetic protein [Bacteroidota bacterium]